LNRDSFVFIIKAQTPTKAGQKKSEKVRKVEAGR
jgi:hypothetical protein